MANKSYETYRPRWKNQLVEYVKRFRRLPIETQKALLYEATKTDTRNITFEEKKTGATLTTDKSSRIKSLEDLILASNIDLDVWEVERYVVNKWEVGSTVDGQIIVEPLFQVKAWLKKNKSAFRSKLVKNEIMQELKKHSPVYDYKNVETKKGNHLLEINIFDLHFGKLCWGEETGDNYDTKIAHKRFMNAIRFLLSVASGYKIDKILFPIGSDFFNSDNLNNQTTAGTPQDEDVRWQKTFRAGRKMLVEAIDLMSMFCPVDVVVVQGNHDWERSFYVGDAIECWYNNNDRVVVNNSASPRKYYKYGLCGIAYTHGNNEKALDLPLIFAQENPDLWSKTKFREWHLGHLHHKKEIKFMSTQEHKGATIRYMRSLSGTDAWHNQKGYIGSTQGCEAFVWSKTDGLVAQYMHNIK